MRINNSNKIFSELLWRKKFLSKAMLENGSVELSMRDLENLRKSMSEISSTTLGKEGKAKILISMAVGTGPPGSFLLKARVASTNRPLDLLFGYLMLVNFYVALRNKSDMLMTT